jgi:hypothetical protein
LNGGILVTLLQPPVVPCVGFIKNNNSNNSNNSNNNTICDAILNSSTSHAIFTDASTWSTSPHSHNLMCGVCLWQVGPFPPALVQQALPHVLPILCALLAEAGTAHNALLV